MLYIGILFAKYEYRNLSLCIRQSIKRFEAFEQHIFFDLHG